MNANIAPDLIPLAHPIDALHELPGNPRRGDVDAVARSYATFGQRKPVVVRRDEEGRAIVVAGNHQLAAAKQLGWTHLAVAWADDLTFEQAQAFALADNRTAELGGYDDELLAAAIAAIDDDVLLAATGWAIDGLDGAGINADLSTEEVELGERYEVVISCTDETQQTQLLNRFLKEGLSVRGLVV